MDPIYFLILAVLLVIILIFFVLKTNQTRVELPAEAQFDPRHYVSKDLYAAVTAQLEMAKIELNDKEQELRAISGQLAARDQQIDHLRTTIQEGKEQHPFYLIFPHLIFTLF